MEEKGVLTVTNSFAIPPSTSATAVSQVQALAPVSNQETSAFEEEMSVQEYEDRMIEFLGQSNYEVNAVGW